MGTCPLKEKIWQIWSASHNFRQKIPSIRIQMTGENKKFQSQFNEIRLKIQIEMKMREEKKTFERENFTILQEKIYSIRFEMTEENSEF